MLLSISDTIPPDDFVILYKSLARQFNNKIDYQFIGDLFYSKGLINEAEKYYRLAIKVGEYEPRALFRIYKLQGLDSEYLSKLLKQKNLFGKTAELTIKEKELFKKIKEL